MALRTGGGKLSFEVLRRYSTVDEDSIPHRSQLDPTQTDRKKRKHRASKKKKKLLDPVDSVTNSSDPHSKKDSPLENGIACNGFELDPMRYCGVGGSVVCEEASEASVCAVTAVSESGSTFTNNVRGDVEGFNFGELRQRNVNGGSSEDLAASVVGNDGGIVKDDSGVKASPVEKPISEPDRRILTKLQTVESLDWKRIMAEDPNCE